MLTLKQVHDYLLSLPGAVEERPFNPETPVYKIGKKMFACTSLDKTPPSITIKLDPLHGQMLRSTYPAVKPGYHMNKEHWNTITLDADISEALLLSWIDESYTLVRASLTKKAKMQLPDAH